VTIKILSPLWGQEHLPLLTFLDRIRAAGYDGIDTPVPEDPSDKRLLFDYVERHGLCRVAHQHRAEGATFQAFRASFAANLQECAEGAPLLINSHTGRDSFSLEKLVVLVDIAQEFTARTGIPVAHETHRGRMGYGPQAAAPLFSLRKDLQITADFSHWVCVTESMLEHFEDLLAEAIRRSRHVHARVGFEQGPQVPNPRLPRWGYAVDHFFGWWDRIVEHNAQHKTPVLPITTEFGPPPYMAVTEPGGLPAEDQFELNTYMLGLLRERYSRYR
jgi:sugar phosphate isomerase/epimerase